MLNALPVAADHSTRLKLPSIVGAFAANGTWTVRPAQAPPAPDRRGQAIQGSLVGIDISGFTALSERLAARGKLGAEELILMISRCYEGLIETAAARGGDVLKFRGDALLMFFGGEEHERRACTAVAEMQSLIATTGRSTSSVGAVELSMAAGVFSGTCHFFLVGSTHRELIVAGPAA